MTNFVNSSGILNSWQTKARLRTKSPLPFSIALNFSCRSVLPQLDYSPKELCNKCVLPTFFSQFLSRFIRQIFPSFFSLLKPLPPFLASLLAKDVVLAGNEATRKPVQIRLQQPAVTFSPYLLSVMVDQPSGSLSTANPSPQGRPWRLILNHLRSALHLYL